MLLETGSYHVFWALQTFIKDSDPLTSLLKGGIKKIVWMRAVDKAFQNFKQAKKRVKTLSTYSKEPFKVEVDASDTGVGAVLS